MKRILIAVILGISAGAFAESGKAIPDNLVGTWVLREMIVNEERQPLLDPDLNLRWTFFANDTARLYWDKKGMTGFCERFSFFTLTGENFADEVFAVNPRNSGDCSKDPDMVMGRQVQTRLQIITGEVLIDMQVGNDKVTYVLTRPDRCDFNSSMVISGRISKPISASCASLPEPR